MTQPTLGEVHTLLKTHIHEHHEDKQYYMSEFKAIRASLDGKVSWKHYTWTLGVMIMILMGLAGFISYQLDKLSTTTSDTNSHVAKIEGKLEPYNVEFKN